MSRKPLDAKARREKHTAERTCIGCRAARPSGELIRLVLAPDGALAVDLDRRLPGRGAHLCPKFSCIEEAVRREAFGRAFRRPVSPPQAEALAEAICERLMQKAIGLMGLGSRSRQVLSGSMALEKGLQGSQVHLLILATDIAPEQRERWLALYGPSGRPWVVCFSKERLGALLGKELRSAAGIVEPKMAQTVYRLVSTVQSIEAERKGVNVHGHIESL